MVAVFVGARSWVLVAVCVVVAGGMASVQPLAYTWKVDHQSLQISVSNEIAGHRVVAAGG